MAKLLDWTGFYTSVRDSVDIVHVSRQPQTLPPMFSEVGQGAQKEVERPLPELSPEGSARIIEEIHNAFNGAGDELLSKAKEIVALPDYDETLLKKSRRLDALGFGSSKDVEKAKDIEITIANVEESNRHKKEEAETIMYFKNKYPLYKYIDETSVREICRKYGLVYGPVERFTGFVPEKNLQEIENFKIDDQDKAVRFLHTSERRKRVDIGMYKTTQMITTRRYGFDGFESLGSDKSERGGNYVKRELAPFEIAAPKKDFDNGDNVQLEGFELVHSKEVAYSVPDPVVLQPVWRNNRKHYLIVTAWGDEASDPLVVNENLN